MKNRRCAKSRGSSSEGSEAMLSTMSKQRKRNNARPTLAEIYNSFSEDFDTVDPDSLNFTSRPSKAFSDRCVPSRGYSLNATRKRYQSKSRLGPTPGPHFSHRTGTLLTECKHAGPDERSRLHTKLRRLTDELYRPWWSPTKLGRASRTPHA